MKALAYLLGIVLLIIAGIYVMLPADQLPSFMPGFDPSLARLRLKHGIVAGGAGVVLFGLGWFLGRSRA
jgi:hypothetical protein